MTLFAAHSHTKTCIINTDLFQLYNIWNMDSKQMLITSHQNIQIHRQNFTKRMVLAYYYSRRHRSTWMGCKSVKYFTEYQIPNTIVMWTVNIHQYAVKILNISIRFESLLVALFAGVKIVLLLAYILEFSDHQAEHPSTGNWFDIFSFVTQTDETTFMSIFICSPLVCRKSDKLKFNLLLVDHSIHI